MQPEKDKTSITNTNTKEPEKEVKRKISSQSPDPESKKLKSQKDENSKESPSKVKTKQNEQKEASKINPKEESKAESSVSQPTKTSPKVEETASKTGTTPSTITSPTEKTKSFGFANSSVFSASLTDKDSTPTKQNNEGFWARYTRENSNRTGISPAVNNLKLDASSPQLGPTKPVEGGFWAKYAKEMNGKSVFASAEKPKSDFSALLKETPAMTAPEVDAPSPKKELKYKEQEIVTGEEDENTVCSYRSRLYATVNGEWKERGVGQLKVNKSKAGYRLVMRADAVLKVILNVRLHNGMPLQQRDRYLEFAAVEDSKLQKFLLQFRTTAICEDIYADFKSFIKKE